MASESLMIDHDDDDGNDGGGDDGGGGDENHPWLSTMWFTQSIGTSKRGHKGK